MSRKALLVAVLALTGLGCSIRAQDVPLPKPQIASAEGKTAPDFTLRDHKGNLVHLAGLRGERVLLIFYRGYW